jgi:AraC-type DNA-binding domain-containing proteins
MESITTLTEPPDSKVFFRINAETPEGDFQVFYFDSETHKFVWDLLCNLSPPKKISPSRNENRVTNGNPERIEKIIRYMKDNLDKKIYLDQVAGHIGMSRKGLSCFCSRYLPGGFTVFLNTLRLNRAANLLLSTDNTVLYIALCCGFESISHFNDQFRKRFGVNPSVFRKNKNKTNSVQTKYGNI